MSFDHDPRPSGPPRWAGPAMLGLALALWPAPPVGAVPGDLDGLFAGFGTDGKVAFIGAYGLMAMGPDGRTVTVGVSGPNHLIVRRTLPNGGPDWAFGGSGQVFLTHPPGLTRRPSAVAVGPDGRILIAGHLMSTADNDVMVLRLTPAGDLDVTFGSGGQVRTDFNGQSDYASAILIQPDGRIVVAGTSTVGADDDFSISRYAPDGSLDATFSGDGKLIIAFGGDDFCYDARLQPDGRIVVVGSGSDEFPEYDRDVCIARLHPDGTLDATFDGDGKATFGLGGSDHALAVAFQSDGKILVAGNSDPRNSVGKLARLHPYGWPDDSFDGDGVMGIPGTTRLVDLEVQPDDRILVVDEGGTLHRLMPSGTPDPSLDGDGSASYQFTAGYPSVETMALLPDGRILLHALSSPDGYSYDGTGLIRVWPDGAEDIGGRQTTAFHELGLPVGAGFPPGSDEQANAMAIQSDGGIVVAGTVVHPVSGERDFALARFTSDGEPDLAFGSFGRVSFSFHNHDVGLAVAIQPDGRIVVAGHTGTGFGTNFLVARFLPSGALDPGFGFSGFNVIDFFGWDDYATSVAIAPDGTIVLGGAAFNGTQYVFAVARFTSEGFADYSFDADARQTVAFQSGLHHDARSVLVQPDRKIVIGGAVGGDFGLARLLESGALDDTFGCQGGVGGGGGCTGRTRIDMGADDHLFAITRAPDGRLYAAGARAYPTGYIEGAVAQFGANGTLAGCPPFPCESWPNGKAYLVWGYRTVAYAMDVRGDGQVVVAGEADYAFRWSQLDPASASPIVTSGTDMPGSPEYATAVRFLGSNQVVLAGRQSFNGDENFALARFETTPATVVGVPAPDGPAADALGALTPNPTRGGATLDFSLAQPSAVELRVHDVSGRLVRVVEAGRLSPGRHALAWDGRLEGGEPARGGVYFVNLRVDGRAAGARTLVALR